MRTTNFSASWARVDQTDDPTFYSHLLDATRAQLLDRARRDPAAVFGPLDLKPGARVLDIGCGTGDYLRALAPLVCPGHAVGIDLSAALITEARRRIGGTDNNVAFEKADAYDLPVPDNSFDRVLATQVLLHLMDEPWRAITQMRRVLTAGGRLVIGAWDWDSTCLAASDRDLGRRFTHLLCDQMHNGLIVRELSSRLIDERFGQVKIIPDVRIARDLDPAFQWLIEPATQELVRAGQLTAEDGERVPRGPARPRTDRPFLPGPYLLHGHSHRALTDFKRVRRRRLASRRRPANRTERDVDRCAGLRFPFATVRCQTRAVHVRLLGSVVAETGGRALPLGGPKQRAVFALLALSANRIVSLDRLVHEIWQD